MENHQNHTQMNANFFDSHMHTTLCKHARGCPSEYVARGYEAGLDGVIFTCHNPMPPGFSHSIRMRMDELWDYIALVDEAGDTAPAGFAVRLGLESDYFPGMGSWLGKLHEAADFHYILGSVRWSLPEYQAINRNSDTLAFISQYLEHLAEAAESGLFDCIAHPNHARLASAKTWGRRELLPALERVFDRIAESGVAMEINASTYDWSLGETRHDEQLLLMMKQRDIPVVLGSDAHSPEKVAGNFGKALSRLECVGYEKISSFQGRQRQEMEIKQAMLQLKDCKAFVGAGATDPGNLGHHQPWGLVSCNPFLPI